MIFESLEMIDLESLELVKCRKMADEIGRFCVISDELYGAFCSVPRTIFSPIAINAFNLDAQPIGGNQWISSPLTVAKMTTALNAVGCDNVLEIGCGSGYQAAILGKICRRVFTIERIEKLASSAKEKLRQLGYNNIVVRYDDGNIGWVAFAPYERILFSCACEERPPQRIVEQLANGGILVAPVKRRNAQFIVKYEKRGAFLRETVIDECEFVPLLSGRA